MIEFDEDVVDETNGLKMIVDAVEQRDCYVRALQRTYSQFDSEHVREVFDKKWERAGVLYGSCIDFAMGSGHVELRGANGFAQMFRAKTLYAYTNVSKMLR